MSALTLRRIRIQPYDEPPPMSNRETLKSALDRIVREIVDATLAAIRDASVAELALQPKAEAAQKKGRAKSALETNELKQPGRKARTSAPPISERRAKATTSSSKARSLAVGAGPRAEESHEEAAAGTAITDPESVLAAFFDTPASPPRASKPRTELPSLLATPAAATASKNGSAAPHASAGSGSESRAASSESRAASTSGESVSSSPAAEAAPAASSAKTTPALRENETAMRTAGGGVVIRRRRSPVQAA
jgi:hypothetical protein